MKKKITKPINTLGGKTWTEFFKIRNKNDKIYEKNQEFLAVTEMSESYNTLTPYPILLGMVNIRSQSTNADGDVEKRTHNILLIQILQKSG